VGTGRATATAGTTRQAITGNASHLAEPQRGDQAVEAAQKQGSSRRPLPIRAKQIARPKKNCARGFDARSPSESAGKLRPFHNRGDNICAIRRRNGARCCSISLQNQPASGQAGFAEMAQPAGCMMVGWTSKERPKAKNRFAFDRSGDLTPVFPVILNGPASIDQRRCF